MLCVQVLLAALGVGVFLTPAIRLGGQECRGFAKNAVGAVLVLQLVLVFGFWFAIGFDQGLKTAKAGKSQPNMAAIERLHQKYQWVEVCVPVGAACVAGILLYVGLKDPDDEPDWQRRHRDRMHDEAFGPEDDDPLGRRYGGRGGRY
jgi:hypothetical protein